MSRKKKWGDRMQKVRAIHFEFPMEYELLWDKLYKSYHIDMHTEVREWKLWRIEAEKIRKGGADRDATKQTWYLR